MALETGTYISDLVTTNPPNTDGVSQADDHLRLIKSTVKATFPNITGAVTLTHTDLNKLTSSGSPQFSTLELGNASDTTLSRSAAGVLAVEGGIVPLENRANTFTNSNTFSASGASSRLRITSGSGNGKYVVYQTAGSTRWEAGSSSAAETGSNAGSSYQISRYDDTGTFIDTPLVISRQSGTVGLNSGSYVGGSTGATNFYVSGGAANNRSYYLQTNFSTRWQLKADSTAEAGSNAGSNFSITRYDDAGNSIASPVTISRATGLTTLESLSVTGATTVGGSPVIAASGTAAQGDVLYHNGTAWTRLPAGTSGQFLKTNGAGANPAWASETVGGVTFLGTITTTSLATQSLTGLNLTGYKFLRAVFSGVSTVASTWDISFAGGVVVNNSTNSSAYSGIVDIDLAIGVGSSVMSTGSGVAGQALATTFTVTNASTSVAVSLGGSSFDAGSVRVYGIA